MCTRVGVQAREYPAAASEPHDLGARPVPAPQFPQRDTGSRPAPQRAASVGAASTLGEHRLQERQHVDGVWTEHGCARAVYRGPWGAVPSLSTGSRARRLPGPSPTASTLLTVLEAGGRDQGPADSLRAPQSPGGREHTAGSRGLWGHPGRGTGQGSTLPP